MAKRYTQNKVIKNALVPEEEPEWKQEWQDMPEFIQEKVPVYREIVVKFETEKDFDDFMSLVNQDVTHQTKWIWFPKKDRRDYTEVWWVDEEMIEEETDES